MPSTSLEQEALDRVARMYSTYDRRQSSKPPEKPEPPKPQPPQPQPKPPQPPEEKPSGLLDVLLKDKEQSLILLLLVILMKDGADLNAVLALMYILL